MATNPAGTDGLGQLSHYNLPQTGTDGPFADLENQTDLYMKMITGVFKPAEFSDTNTYLSTKPKNGLGQFNGIDKPDIFTSSQTYIDHIQSSGSDILDVDGTQVGNEEKSIVGDYTEYNKYIKK